QFGAGVHQHFPLVSHAAMRLHAAVLVVPRERLPLRRTRDSHRRALHVTLDARDQRVLPGEPLHLPGAQCSETRARERAGGEHHHQRTPRPRAGSFHQGMLRICCGSMGIMFSFMWTMTQTDPASMITTTMIVNRVAS